MGQQRLDRTRQRRIAAKSVSMEGEEEETESVAVDFNN